MKPWDNGPLRVAATGRSLEYANGKPFFYLADTCWEAFHRLTREDIELLLHTRAKQGFNSLQMVALAEMDGLNEPNREGARPLVNNDPLSPDTAGGYWDFVDYVFDRAEHHDLYIALLPTWGDKVTPAWGTGPAVFDEANAYHYGAWIAQRYGGRPNIIWVNGGDRDGGYAIWNSLAAGIRAGEPRHNLMTFHPQGEMSSAEYFHQESWLDFNMLQTGHGDPSLGRITRMIQNGRERTPAKPILDGEPRYENHPIEFNVRKGFFDAGDVRQAIYTGLFAGGCGFTYGCHAIWQFAQDRYAPINNPISHWKYSLQLPGANQMKFAKQLLLEVGFPNLDPVATVMNDRSEYLSLRNPETSVVLTYLHAGGQVRPLFGHSRGEWFDPRTGQRQAAELSGRTYEAPKSNDRVNDWVLILHP